MLSLFLAKRFFLKGDVNNENRRKASAPAIVIATAGIAIGLAVMLISVCIVRGFQNEVRNKLEVLRRILKLWINAFIPHPRIIH